MTEHPADTRATVIATPTQDHHVSALACLERGRPGWPVILENPVAATLDQARSVVDAAADTTLREARDGGEGDMMVPA